MFSYFLSVNHDKKGKELGGRNTSHFLNFPFYVYKAKHRLHWMKARAFLLCKTDLLVWA